MAAANLQTDDYSRCPETENIIYIYSSDQFAKYAKEHGKRLSDQAYAELEAANSAREHNELEQRLVLSKPLAELESQQVELAERLKGPLAGYEAKQRELADRLSGRFAGYEAKQRELAERLSGRLVGIQALQPELGRASKNLSDVDKTDIYDKKKLDNEESGSEDLRMGRDPDDHPKRNGD
jgi:hypothetical protein